MDDTRQKLIDVAGQTFSEKGFEATTVREVCQLAGVNIAAIHYHFGIGDACAPRPLSMLIASRGWSISIGRSTALRSRI